MPEPMLKFSVTCPNCALESVSEMPIALIANALLTGKAIRLRAQCHDEYWTATIGEREQIRSALREIRVDMPTATPRHSLVFTVGMKCARGATSNAM